MGARHTGHLDAVHRNDAGQASVTYLLAITMSLVVFVMMTNLLMFLYARAVIRAAVDEGARAGSVANGSEIECLARATDTLDDLLAGPMGNGVALSCVATGSEIVATANVTLTSPFPGITDWTFTSIARATDESAVVG